MPEKRLERARASLPDGYQFGDAASTRKLSGIDWFMDPDPQIYTSAFARAWWNEADRKLAEATGQSEDSWKQQ